MTHDPRSCLEWIPTLYRRHVYCVIAHSVMIAHQARADWWGLRLEPESLMLKVGPHEVLQIIRPDRARRHLPCHLVVNRDLIPGHLRARASETLWFSEDEDCYEQREAQSYYRSNPGTEACKMAFSVFEETYPALRNAHMAVIQRAAGLRLNPATRQNHSSALVCFLASEMGHSLAQPAWLTSHEKQE